MLLADHSNFRRSAPMLLCPPSPLTALITDMPVSEDLYAVLHAAGVEVQIVRA